MRRPLFLIAAVFGCLLGAGPAQAADSADWCSAKAPPCIVSASREGTPVAATDPNFDVRVVESDVEKSKNLLWHISKPASAELGSGEIGKHWALTIDTGDIVPRVSSEYGDDVTVTRQPQPGGTYRITIAGTPVTTTNNDDCDTSVWPWTCPATATSEFQGYFAGEVTDYGTWEDVDQREAMYGIHYARNIAVTSLPPEIEDDPATGAQQLLIRMANQHAHPDGSPFVGFLHMRIPNRFLRLTYGVDDPASMTSTSLKTSIGAGSASVTQEPGADAMLVDVTGITFSHRLLRIRRGTVVPTKPTKVHAERTSKHGARIRFQRSKSRGSKVTSYVARCTAKHAAASGNATGPPIKLGELEEGVAYRCRVRARSKAGPGPWSKPVNLPAKPG
jgi:hypothetical protein